MHKIDLSFALLVGKYIYIFLLLCVFHRRSKLMQVCYNMMRGKNDDRIFIFVWTIPLNVVRNFTGADKNRNLEGSGKKHASSQLASIYGHYLN